MSTEYNPLIELKFGVKGKFKFEVKKSPDAEPHRTLEFSNMITNTGLNFLLGGNRASIMQSCAVGTGTTPPATTDTAMQSFVAKQALNTTSFNSGGAPNYEVNTVKTYNFTVGAAAGNLTEVGIGQDNGAVITTLSRALIVDSFGNPTTLTILPDEYLTVTYTITIVPNLSDTVVTVSGYTLTIRVANINIVGGPGSGGWGADFVGGVSTLGGTLPRLSTDPLQATTSIPSGTLLNSSDQTDAAYTNGTFFRDSTAVWSPTSGTITNAQTLIWQLQEQTWQIGLSPNITKTTSQSLTVTFRVSLARV